jgi:hypothetical protein
MPLCALLLVAAASSVGGRILPPPSTNPVDFARDIAPIFAVRCLGCHGPSKQRSGYRLDVKSIALAGGELHAPNILPGQSAESPLIRFVAGLDADMTMPPKGDLLSDAEIGLLRRWIDDGAIWPDDASVKATDPLDWWSLRPLAQPAIPQVSGSASTPTAASAAHPIDAFVVAKLATRGLHMSPEADARALHRRVRFDLIGLPPTPEELDAFDADARPDRYERLVDELLASPRYGERWARHWLDAVHYGDSHGYDKDQPRPNAWPYRDYVIRALNSDKPYARFVEEQLAGDALYPGTQDGIEALGFIAAGPWDLIGHAEVGEEKIDGKFARHFDRDDMVGNAIGTFTSTTVQCAQCHNHKFDPITQDDYYALQSVFAALDRADRGYDTDPAVAARRAELVAVRRALEAEASRLADQLAERGGKELAALEREIQSAQATATQGARLEYGWHSAIASIQEPAHDARPWVMIDLGSEVVLERVVLTGAFDDFQGIGAGFGFPERFRIEAATTADFRPTTTVIAAHDLVDYTNPGTAPQSFAARNITARYVRVTATKLALRAHDFIFALAELEVYDATGRNVARGASVSSRDSVEQLPRWSRINLTDGIYPEVQKGGELAQLQDARHALVARILDDDERSARTTVAAAIAENSAAIAALPLEQLVYAGTVHHGSGTFRGTGAQGGRPRDIRILARGQVTNPGRLVGPAVIAALDPVISSRLNVEPDEHESARRAALAGWITDPRNPLTWRSIVNRIWQFHFGRGIVETANDFGHMGSPPTHPELLDWLAVEFRDGMRGSLKQLHRLIVTSATYRQRSTTHNEDATRIDSGNTLLWRANARKLEAEAVRDAVLATAGTLDLSAGGPGWRDFVIERPEHSPHYRYDLADPNDPATWRRSIYRFIVRSQMQPFMTMLDCADPSMRVDRRNESLSPSQALAFLNNGFMITQAKHFATRVARECPDDLSTQVVRAFRLAIGRTPSESEAASLRAFASAHGLPNACRVLLNLNEFTFID